MAKENIYLSQEYLSKIELYYSSDVVDNYIQMSEEESKHILKVMRHTIGDEFYVTDGKGSIFKVSIIEACSTIITLRIIERNKNINLFEKIYFCFPRLKKNDRFEFALEKCIELGITNFIIFESDRTIAKGEKLDRWNKIALAAMKQSLRSYKPNIKYVDSVNGLNEFSGLKLIFDQNSESNLKDFFSDELNVADENVFFIFGPEGSLMQEEIASITNSKKVKLTNNRLRTETAVVSTASLLSQVIQIR